MSTLISSFLLEPVLRHARRMSSSGSIWDVPRLYGARDQPHDILAEAEDDFSQPEEMALDSPDPSSRDPSAIAAEADYQNLTDAVIAQPWVQSPVMEVPPASPNAIETRERTNSHPQFQSAPPQPRRVDAIRSRGTSDTTNDDTSSNPEHGIPERFSRTNSVSSTAESPVGHPGTPTVDRPQDAPADDVQNRRSSQYGSPSRSQALPEDDGMGALRKRIIQIREMEIPNLEKARILHTLMTERYNLFHPQTHTHIAPTTHSPSSLSHGSSLATSGGHSGLPATIASTPLSVEFGPELDHPYFVTEEDRNPTFRPKKSTPPITSETSEEISSALAASGTLTDDGDGTDTENPGPELGCKHYKRNVKLRCSTCNRWYTCRFCHDEVEDHTLIRKETKYMLCMLCGIPQPASERCLNCGVRSAWYYCNICKLWDDDAEKSIYHCDDCGICRVGKGLGKDFFHCKTCGVCMSISLINSHRCIERSTDCDCPICGEYMFTSPETVVFMPCGHSIHHKCYYQHMQTSYRCPICSKSMVNMETQFRNLDRTIESQPMPEQFRDTRAMVYCNDCCAKSVVSYHWLGLKCAVCDSYNTAQLQILSDQDAEAELELPSSPLAGTHMLPDLDMDAAEPALPPAAPPVATARPVSRGRILQGDATVIRDQSPHLSGGDAQPSQRPTSYAGPGSTSDGRRFSPYPIPRRIGRSASPFATERLPDGSEATMFDGAMETTENNPATREDGEAADEEEDLSFWGGAGGRNGPAFLRAITRSDDWNDEDEDEDEEMESDEEELEEEEDDEDDNDGWDLIGHR